MGAIVAGTVAWMVVYSAGQIGSTAAGLMLIYSLSFTDILTFLARKHADVSKTMNLFFLLTCTTLNLFA